MNELRPSNFRVIHSFLFVDRSFEISNDRCRINADDILYEKNSFAFIRLTRESFSEAFGTGREKVKDLFSCFGLWDTEEKRLSFAVHIKHKRLLRRFLSGHLRIQRDKTPVI